MKIAFANDHAGLDLREPLFDELRQRGVDILDFGTSSPDSVDYPVQARKACQAIGSGQADRAVLVCGTGIGISIAANKFSGIRCALVYDEEAARLCRLHNDANVLALRGRGADPDLSRRLLGIWLETEFSGDERHLKRIRKIQALER
jgi:ribose 5-phosphate isomerase B